MTTTPPRSGRKRKAPASADTPSKRARFAEGLLEDPLQYETALTEGQIKSIKLRNWVTFDSTVIECEPGLNLIVGPNGTGKSSIVCAIGLGLAGKAQSLGRGEKPSDFIKYGRQEASIEIELHNEQNANDVIKRIITKSSTSWKLNGRKVGSNAIKDFVRKDRNIKVDNLCQFLAQDRVSEFARLSPTDLLIETEKAIEDDQLFRWHNYLIEEGEKANTSQSEIENLEALLRRHQAELDSLNTTIQQFDEKNKLLDTKKSYEALKEWTVIRHKKEEYGECAKFARKLQRQFDKKKQDVGPIEKEAHTLRRKVDQLKLSNQEVTTMMDKIGKRKGTSKAQITKIATSIGEDENRIAQADQDVKTRQKRIKLIEDQINKLEHSLDAFNPEEIERAKEERQSVLGDVRRLRKERNTIESTARRVMDRKKDHEHELLRIRRTLEQYSNVGKQREDHIFNQQRAKERQFKVWVESQRSTFAGAVYGPICNEMDVHDDQGALFLNAMISINVFYGYVCTHSADWTRLVREAGNKNLNMTVYTSSNPDAQSSQSQAEAHRPVDVHVLQRNGVDGYLDQLFDAPDIIKQTLNDQLGLNKIAFARNEPDAQQLDNVLVTVSRERGKLKRLCTPQSVYSVKESHYDTNVLRSMENLRMHRNPILRKMPDYSAQIAEANAKKEHVHEALNQINQQRDAMMEKKNDIAQQLDQAQGKKQSLDQKISEFGHVQSRLRKKREDLVELERDASDPEEQRNRWTAAIQEKDVKRIEYLEKYAADSEEMHALSMRLNHQRIAAAAAALEFKAMQDHIGMVRNRNKQMRRSLDEARQRQEQLRKRYESCLAQARQKYPRGQFKGKWTEDDCKLSVDEIETKINRLDGRINVLFIDPARVERYKSLERKLAVSSQKLSKLTETQHSKKDKIREIENQWRPQLQEAVKKISLKFGEFFRQFNKAEGKVELVSHEDGEVKPYSEWCIDILTKFRADQPWKRLTSSSQSGGEKSVSTMLYLLSLQQVTTVPFRVVDEINQGMDPHNERRIMQILNYECTPKRRHRMHDDGAIRLPQYFVVTPKLLPRLEYSPCSSVYVIFNGPFQMPQEYWDMGGFLESQRILSQSPPKGGKTRNRRDHMSESEEEESDDTDDR